MNHSLERLARRTVLSALPLALVMGAGTSLWGQETSPMPLDYAAMMRALKPTMIFEVTEGNFNAYLDSKPEGLMIPAGFEAPKVALADGLFEISARKEILFISTRVRVAMSPEVVRGRLRLRVRRVSAGPIPLPPDFHAGVSHTIEDFVNELLERNQFDLVRVEIGRGMLRVTARVAPEPPSAAPVEGQP